MRIIAKIGWVLSAVGAVVLGVLAALYGKKTPQVVRAKLRENKARERSLKLDLEVEETEAARSESLLTTQKHLDKAAKLGKSLERVRREKTKILAENGAPDDDALATTDNINRST